MTATETLLVHTRWLVARDLPAAVAIDRACGAGWWDADRLLTHLRERNVIGMVAEAGDDILAFGVYELHRDSIRLLRFAALEGETAAAERLLSKLLYKASSHRRERLEVPFALAVRLGGLEPVPHAPLCVSDVPVIRPHWRTDAVRWMCAADDVYLPVLADALEDAGCEHEPLLALFRAGGDAATAVYEAMRDGLK